MNNNERYSLIVHGIAFYEMDAVPLGRDDAWVWECGWCLWRGEEWMKGGTPEAISNAEHQKQAAVFHAERCRGTG